MDEDEIVVENDDPDRADDETNAEDINLEIASLSGWNEFSSSYLVVNNIFSNLITAQA